MTEGDIPDAAQASADASGLDIGASEARARWERRVLHSFQTDPDGAFVTERDGRIAGIAEAIVRERTWILSLLAASPATGGRGDGRALLEAALAYGAGQTDSGLIVVSNDPRAMALYGSAGFSLEPTFEARGRPDASRIPPPDPSVTVVPPEQLHTLAPISRTVRGSEHTPELAYIQREGATILRLDDRGFTVVAPGRGVWALAALDEASATTLLWAALHRLRDDEEVEINFFTGAQQWALAVLLDARIPFRSFGGLAQRGVAASLYPYIPSTPFA